MIKINIEIEATPSKTTYAPWDLQEVEYTQRTMEKDINQMLIDYLDNEWGVDGYDVATYAFVPYIPEDK